MTTQETWAARIKAAAFFLVMGLVLCALVACAAPEGENGASGQAAEGSGADPIVIATKPMTEQFILGEMLKALVEDAGYEATITKGVGGGTNNIQPAMERGDFDLYPEYTSSGWVMVLGNDATGISDDDMFAQLQEQYQEKYDMSWVGLYGFNNTFTVAVRDEIAQQHNLKTTSDLAAAAPELVFGGNPDYIEREDGFGLLTSTYGLEFGQVMDIDIGLKYQALRGGDIDVTNGFTTDAQLAAGGVTTLEDDKHLQVNYFCSTVVRNDTLASHPGLEEALLLMQDILTDKDMAQLNYQVEVEGADEAKVARDYLASKGVLKAAQ